MTDYSISQALQAKEEGDTNYFFQVLPRPTLSDGVVSGAPVPPSQRDGWVVVPYPDIPDGLVGQFAKDVLIPPAFPLDTSGADGEDFAFFDPHPDNVVQEPVAVIGEAPDGSIAIEITYTPDAIEQFVDAYFPMLDGGKRHLGVQWETYIEADFDFGPEGSGGKICGGMFAGNRPSTGLTLPWAQRGVTARNIWRAGTDGTINDIRLYTYNLNRFNPEGQTSARTFDKIVGGQWQRLEYEAQINTPGFADGLCRMWIDDECQAEMTDVVWAINDEWSWRGLFLSDTWQLGTINQVQKRWIRPVAAYYPAIFTGYGNFADGYVQLDEPVFSVVSQTNLGIGTARDFGSGSSVISFANVGTVPSSMGFSGAILCVQSGALHHVGPDGTVTILAPA